MQRIETKIIDDIDGTEGAATVRFGWEGRQYEIDLTSDNRDKLADMLAPYVAHGRKVTSAGGVLSERVPGKRGEYDRKRAVAIREWAKANGFPDVADRGRIPATIVEAYENRDQTKAEVTPEQITAELDRSTPWDPFKQPDKSNVTKLGERAEKGTRAPRVKSDAPLPTDDNIMKWVRDRAGQLGRTIKEGRTKPTPKERADFMSAHMQTSKHA